MKRIPLLFLVASLMGLCSCTSIESEMSDALGARGGHIRRFYATTEQSGPETKVYADEQLRVLWNEGDLLSVFNQSTYNSKFEFTGEDGDNAGDFEDVTPSGLHSGNSLSYIYAVYPYDKGNKINNDGIIITLTLPAEQQYKEHSFGIGANTMVAVTDNDFLAFKNLGGYLQLRLYGDDVKVSSITIQGNNGEKIAGKASVAVGLGAMPTVAMDATATEAITLVCDPPVQLGTTAEQYTDFWFVIPPVAFEGGFTVTVTDELGGVFQKTTTKSLTISRSTIEWMAALEVTPDYDNTNIVFEDANFKAYCVENFDKDNDGEISRQEALLVTTINCNGNSIKSLSGVEHFVNLTSLICYSNQLTSLDVSHNTALTELLCGNNQLTSLDVSNNAALARLRCYDNQLTSLDVSHNTALSFLDCGSNQLTSLEVSHNAALTELWCYENQLTSLDVRNNSDLTWLYCSVNQMTSLDVNQNTALSLLTCSSNQFTTLDVSHNTALTTLECDNNQLTSLDVSHNTALTRLHCHANQLTCLDVSHNTALKELWCSNNQLTSLDVSNNTALSDLSCLYNNAGMFIYVRTGQVFNKFVCDNSAIIQEKGTPIPAGNIVFDDSNFKACCVQSGDKNGDGEISYAEALLVTYINCNSRSIQSLFGIEFFENLTSLWCTNNQLTSLDVSNNTKLVSLYCYSNELASLDVSNNTALTYLSCGFNQLTSLDVSHNTALIKLDCYANQLTSLDVSHNVALTSLSCYNNQLTSLVLGENTELTFLSCYSNQLTNLDVNYNTALTTLWCTNNQLMGLDVSHNAALTSFLCFSNQLTILDVSANTTLTELDCRNNPYLTVIWLRTGQTIDYFQYDTSVATIKRKD